VAAQAHRHTEAVVLPSGNARKRPTTDSRTGPSAAIQENEMSTDNPNYTIVVNWRTKGFGCVKNCQYCNWRDSPLLPHGGQSVEAVSSFITQCRKSFITISGGADPLYRYEEYGDQLLEMVAVIKTHGYRVRLITREVRHIAKLRGVVDHFSVSLDADVLDEIDRHRADWIGLDIDYSLVLPPIPSVDLVRLKPQYAALRSKLGGRLVLRENLNSIFPVDGKSLSFGHNGIVFVPKALCLSGRYLSTIDCAGHEIIQDNEALAGYLMGSPNAYLFGGMVRHLVSSAIHPEYGDIDLIATDPAVIGDLTRRFGYTFQESSDSNQYPRYFLGKSSRAGKTIQLILMRSQADALKFIHNAQYELDRIGYSNQRFLFDPQVGAAATLNGIMTKRARLIAGERDQSLFHPERQLIEQRHRSKLLGKRFTIHRARATNNIDQ
jgi:hypothetical protein